MTEISATKKNSNVFALMRTRKDCYYPPVNVDYTPLQTSNQTALQILPKFNLDSNYYTPAFINPYEQARFKENTAQLIQKEREKFLKKVQVFDKSTHESNPQFNPRDDNYCSICKSGFKYYWSHINCAGHKRKIKSNKVNSFIHQLCSQLRGEEFQNIQIEQHACKAQNKKKKIYKQARKSKKVKQTEVYRPEDFIVKLPNDLFSKEVQNVNYNISTNGLNSMQHQQLKP